MGGFFLRYPLPLFLLFTSSLYALFGNYAKDEISANKRPKQTPSYQFLTSAKKTIKKAKEKTMLTLINKRKSNELKPRKKPQKKPKGKNNI